MAGPHEVPHPPPTDEERCRRRGTPNWRCPDRALPGKSHCLKHYLFYVARRHRLKAAGKLSSGGTPAASSSSSVEPYRPIIDFDFRTPPVQTGGGGLNDQSALVGAEMMSRSGGVDLWNGGFALGGLGFGGNGSFTPGGGMGFQVGLPSLEGSGRGCGVMRDGQGKVFDGLGLMGKFEGSVNFDRVKTTTTTIPGASCAFVGFNQNPTKKKGRPKGSKSMQKVEETEDRMRMRTNVGRIHHDDHSIQNQNIHFDHGNGEGCKKRQNLSWAMRDRQCSDSDSENDDEGFEDNLRVKINLNDKQDEGLWCDDIGEFPSISTDGNGKVVMKKKRGRPKGSKNKPNFRGNEGGVDHEGFKNWENSKYWELNKGK